jgi:hypothetical protein
VVLYITCISISKPRYIKYNFSEKKKQIDRIKYFYINYYYLDSDKKVFSKISIIFRIKEFYRTKRINSLRVFPFLYYQKKKETRIYLDKYNRKFLFFMGIYYYYYQGIAFYIKKNYLVKLFINSRIMVDTIYFQETNPNYISTNINKSNKKNLSLSS